MSKLASRDGHSHRFSSYSSTTFNRAAAASRSRLRTESKNFISLSFKAVTTRQESLAAAQARRDALHSSTSSDLLPEYKSDSAIPPPPIETPPSRGSSYRLPQCSPAYADTYPDPPPRPTRATSAEELRERFRNVGLSDLSP